MTILKAFMAIHVFLLNTREFHIDPMSYEFNLSTFYAEAPALNLALGKLKIFICNPTHNFLHHFNGIRYGDLKVFLWQYLRRLPCHSAM